MVTSLRDHRPNRRHAGGATAGPPPTLGPDSPGAAGSVTPGPEAGGVVSVLWPDVTAVSSRGAVLSQSRPSDSYLAGYGVAAARWRVPDGQWRSGTLTTETAPGISGAPAGTRVRVWLTSSGDPAAPPGSQAGTVFTAVLFAIDGAGGAGIVMIICYWLCRLALDRRRLAAWESARARIGPLWTTRAG